MSPWHCTPLLSKYQNAFCMLPCLWCDGSKQAPSDCLVLTTPTVNDLQSDSAAALCDGLCVGLFGAEVCVETFLVGLQYKLPGYFLFWSVHKMWGVFSWWSGNTCFLQKMLNVEKKIRHPQYPYFLHPEIITVAPLWISFIFVCVLCIGNIWRRWGYIVCMCICKYIYVTSMF